MAGFFCFFLRRATCRACLKSFSRAQSGNNKMEGFCGDCTCRLLGSSASGNILACNHESIMHRDQKTEDCLHFRCTRQKSQTDWSPCVYCSKMLAVEACVSLACGHIYHYSCFSSQLDRQIAKGLIGERPYLADVCCAVCSSVFSWEGSGTLEGALRNALEVTLDHACATADVITVSKLAGKGLEGPFLHTAAVNGHLEVIKILFTKSKQELKLNEIVTRLEHSPLHLAATGGHEKVVMFLVALGADVDIRRSSSNKTPLHEVAEKGNGEMVQLLLRLGASVDTRATYNNTPLHLAVSSGNFTAVKALLQYRANVNVRNDYGLTPLYIAVAKSNADTAKLLVDAGARPNKEILSLSQDIHMRLILQHVIHPQVQPSLLTPPIPPPPILLRPSALLLSPLPLYLSRS